MSPEQARGHLVDARTDIWAFGCVLYEMLTGRAAFARETRLDTFAAILGREPDWAALPRSTPATIQRLLRQCLEKNPRSRPQKMAVVSQVIRRALDADLLLLTGETYGWVFAPEFSPSGEELAVSWNRLGGPRGLYILSWPGLVPRLLADGQAMQPIGWSADGASIVATSEGGIWRVPRSGGNPRIVTEVNTLGGDVTRDGRYIVTSVVKVTADAWLIENFDPQAEGRN
jgi:serine/threonine protein kinase